MKRIVAVDATGRVISAWQGGDEQTLEPVDGVTFIEVDAADYSGKRWTGAAFEDAPVVKSRLLSRIDFMRRFTQAERIAIRAAGENNQIVKDTVFMLDAAMTVNMDHSDVAAALAYLTQLAILGTGRAAEILA